MVTAVAVPIAFGLDVAIGEPPRWLHPVAWFGALLARFDRQWAHPRAVGLALAAVAPLAVAAVAGLLAASVATSTFAGGIGVAGVVLFLTTSWRRLIERSRSVITASEADLEGARYELPTLVGRDPSTLTPGQVRSAALESAAENLADGLVAPLFAFAIGGAMGATVGPIVSLALASAAATWVKAVNTLDSMIGYPDRPHGRAAARMDDVVMWAPARLAASLLALVALRPGVLGTIQPWLDGVASPNAGWPMGVVAAIAGCRLEKPGAYVLNAGAELPDVEGARSGVRTVAWAGIAAYGLATIVATMGVLVTWS